MRSKVTCSHEKEIFVSLRFVLHLPGRWMRSAVTPGVKWDLTKAASSVFYGTQNIFLKPQQNHTKWRDPMTGSDFYSPCTFPLCLWTSYILIEKLKQT